MADLIVYVYSAKATVTVMSSLYIEVKTLNYLFELPS